MACSKIFSGNLPEITTDIIQYLRNDLKSLYSCVLVNRLLCRITIPILWEDPFSVKCQEEYPCSLLDTYLLFFNEDDKTKLKEFGITINLPSFQKPLFNYPSFIKTLNTFRVELHTVNWINNHEILPDDSNQSTCSTNSSMTFISSLYENMNMYDDLNSKQIRDFFCISLFKLFINNNVSLNNLYLSNYCLEIYKIILNHPKFLSDIETFTFNCSNIYLQLYHHYYLQLNILILIL